MAQGRDHYESRSCMTAQTSLLVVTSLRFSAATKNGIHMETRLNTQQPKLDDQKGKAYLHLSFSAIASGLSILEDSNNR